MFVDASAICAILLDEPEADALIAKLDAAAAPFTSPLALFEATLAVARARQGNVPAARRDIARFLATTGMEVRAIAAPEYEAALDAFERYGKGRHPARLNLGDCFAYACARTHGVPLLFKGDDFPQTDVGAA
jgi:ribonuclease VapC